MTYHCTECDSTFEPGQMFQNVHYTLRRCPICKTFAVNIFSPLKYEIEPDLEGGTKMKSGWVTDEADYIATKQDKDSAAVQKEGIITPEVDTNHECNDTRNNFIEALLYFIDYWHDLPDKTTRQRMEGAVFSILAALDGENGSLPPYAVRPLDEYGNEGEDMSGSLHDIFYHNCKGLSAIENSVKQEAGMRIKKLWATP